MSYQPRTSCVPWLSPSDLMPAGPSAWSVDTGDMITRGWTVEHPWGGVPAVLVVTEIRRNGTDGRTITLSIADTVPSPDEPIDPA